MRLNQRGDALTLAMGAAAFVAVSVMVMVGIVSHLDNKTRRIRVMNEMAGIELSLKQVFGNRDLCRGSMRNAGGVALGFNIPAPDNVVRTYPIGRLYWGAAGGPLLCVQGDGTAGCATNANAPVTQIDFVIDNFAANNRPIDYRGNKVGRYRLYSGRVRLRFANNLGGAGFNLFGGHLQDRDFGVQMVVDTADSSVVMCYSALSPAQICAQLGGNLDAATGACVNMFGTCQNIGGDANPNANLPACPVPPGGAFGCQGPRCQPGMAAGVDGYRV